MCGGIKAASVVHWIRCYASMVMLLSIVGSNPAAVFSVSLHQMGWPNE